MKCLRRPFKLGIIKQEEFAIEHQRNECFRIGNAICTPILYFRNVVLFKWRIV